MGNAAPTLGRLDFVAKRDAASAAHLSLPSSRPQGAGACCNGVSLSTAFQTRRHPGDGFGAVDEEGQ
jgi:hypothetical protein